VAERSDATSSLNDLQSWHDVPWKEVNRAVVSLRRRIFLASRSKDFRKLRRLQLLMLKSHSNLLFSIRRVCANKGGKTPGVDGVILATPADRLKFFLDNREFDWVNYSPSPVKRIYVPKPDGRKRPIGIPSMRDRIFQMVCKSALEPEWEARFEMVSYGFRPSRSVNDCINRLWLALHKAGSRQWIVDADTSLCFDSISHDCILEKVENFPWADVIRKWLKSGLVLESVWLETDDGTPQGGTISPLLANIAFDGLESELGVKYTSRQVRSDCRLLIRYADDLVVLCHTKADATAALDLLRTHLAKRGLDIAEAKTRIVHVAEGFDFLGFNIALAPKDGAPDHVIRREGDDFIIDYDGVGCYVHPSEKSIRKVMTSLADTFRKNIGSSAEVLISKVNPIIRGWVESKRCWHSSRTFRKLDNYLFTLQLRWMKRKHPTKSFKWKRNQYFTHVKFGPINNRWVFRSPGQKLYMFQFKWYHYFTHIMTQMKACPDDKQFADYYLDLNQKRLEIRRRNANPLDSFLLTLLTDQQELCPVCGSPLYGTGEDVHIHHIVPRSKGGSNSLGNLVVLHLGCHHAVHYGSQKSEWQEKLMNFKRKSFKS